MTRTNKDEMKKNGSRHVQKWKDLGAATSAILDVKGSRLIDSISSLLAEHFSELPLSQVERQMCEQMTAGSFFKNDMVEDAIPAYSDVLNDLADQLSNLEAWILLTVQHSEITQNTAVFQVQSYLRNEITAMRSEIQTALQEIPSYWDTRAAKAEKNGYSGTTVTKETAVGLSGIHLALWRSGLGETTIVGMPAVTSEVDVDAMKETVASSSPASTPTPPTMEWEKRVVTGPPAPLGNHPRLMATLSWDVLMYARMRSHLLHCTQVYEAILTQSTKLHITLNSPAGELRHILCIFRMCGFGT